MLTQLTSDTIYYLQLQLIYNTMPLNEMMKIFRDSLPTKGSLGLIINVCHSNMSGIPQYNYTTFYKRVIISESCNLQDRV